jgi:hypothetical protein
MAPEIAIHAAWRSNNFLLRFSKAIGWVFMRRTHNFFFEAFDKVLFPMLPAK